MNRYLKIVKIVIISSLSILLMSFLLFILGNFFSRNNIERFVNKYGYNENAPNIEQFPISYQYKDLSNPYYLKAGSRYPDIRETYAVKVSSVEIYKRDSYEFNTFLIKYPYDNISFKNEEGWTSVYNRNPEIWINPLIDDDSDYYMTPLLAEKVNELQNKLENMSQRFIIRITDAYDYNLEHKRSYYRSLHYTGRAADITIYDTYRCMTRVDLLPLLYMMCKEVGFDFILYHKGSHIHASVTPEDIPEVYLSIWSDGRDSTFSRMRKINMKKTGKKGWYKTKQKLPVGLYNIFFYTKDYEYGFRDKTYLGRNDKVGYQYDYYGYPITINIKKSGEFDILFNPHFLRYNIVGDGSIETIIDDSYRRISEIYDEDDNSSAK